MSLNLGYIAQAETNDGLLKVGRSRAPVSRVKGIAAGVPFKVRLIAIFADGPKLEREIKEVAKGEIVRGEWYYPSQSIIKYIQAAAASAQIVEQVEINEDYVQAYIIPKIIGFLAGRPCGVQPLGDLIYRILNGQPLTWVTRKEDLRKACPNIFTSNDLYGFQPTAHFLPISVPAPLHMDAAS